MNETTTIASQIAAMNDQEIAEMNQKLNKMLMKKLGASIVIGLAAFAATEYIARNIDKNDDQ